MGTTARKGGAATGSRLRVSARAWIELNGRFFLGPGKARLLRAVDDVGSISGAARSIGLSYRAAWNYIDAMNRRAGALLVATLAGGTRGGGARLTDLGRAALAAYAVLERELETFRDRTRAAVERALGDLPALAGPIAAEDERTARGRRQRVGPATVRSAKTPDGAPIVKPTRKVRPGSGKPTSVS
jgi:molybdate transport system regulatory protein